MPYALVYEMEAITPIEVEIPSLRILVEAKIGDVEWVKIRYEQLNMIEGKRLVAMCHGQVYQKRMARAFNRKLHLREFKAGDLILKRILPYQEDNQGKWVPIYEGPYIVKHVFSKKAV